MNIVVELMLQIYFRCLQVLNIDLTSTANSLYKDIKACNYTCCQKCEIIKFRKKIHQKSQTVLITECLKPTSYWKSMRRILEYIDIIPV